MAYWGIGVPKQLTDRLPARLSGEHSPVVSVVRLHGMIAAGAAGLGRQLLNADSVEGSLKRAFAADGVQAVALSINSPGGSPTQSQLIGNRIRQLATKHEVPVIAFCEDLAASGGYWLACAADEIITTPTSLLGSVGVVSSGFGLEGLISKLGVERRLHTAGTNKARLDPFSPEKDDDVEWLLGMQADIHTEFGAWVRERRGDKLVGTDEELFTGEVWIGRKAVELGLADGLGTMRDVLAERYPDAELQVVHARKSLAARLGLPAALMPGSVGLPGAAVALVGALEQRAAWSRFGL
ncbi:MAG: S49 family peptidase [Mycobacteriaceae bacterium]